MRILLAAAAFSSELSGVQRHAFNVAYCLLAHPKVSAVQLVIAPWQQELVRNSRLKGNARLSIHVAEMQPGSLHRNLWYYARLPEMAAQLEADVVHLSYPVPVKARAFRCPVVVTLHDLYPYEIPSNFGHPKVVFNRLILQECLRSVNSIACVSDSTQRLLERYVPKVSAKALRIYNCVVAEELLAMRPPIGLWTSGPFLLCVAQHRRNKNIPFLLQVLRRLIQRGRVSPSMSLIVVGISGPDTALIQRCIVRFGLGRNVLLMKGLSDSALQCYYRTCEALLAPSKTEGFGLPVVEALLAGGRVVCSDIPAFRELGGDHCRFVKLDERAEEAFGDAIVSILQEPRRKPISMPMLSAPVIANQYVRLYSKLIAAPSAVFDPVLSNAKSGKALQ